MKLRAISIYGDGNTTHRGTKRLTGTWYIAMYEALLCSLVPGQTYMWGSRRDLGISQWDHECVKPLKAIVAEAKRQAQALGVRYVPDITLGGHEGLSDLEVLGEMGNANI